MSNVPRNHMPRTALALAVDAWRPAQAPGVGFSRRRAIGSKGGQRLAKMRLEFDAGAFRIGHIFAVPAFNFKI